MSRAARTYAAVDLGAESGRVVTGRFDGERVDLDMVHRFANRAVRLPDGLRWNLLGTFAEALAGLERAGALDGIGVDSWGVDYALLDSAHRVLELPFHYRDRRTDGMLARADRRVPHDEHYAITGIQRLPFNTVFQLLADEDSAALRHARHIALIPDLIGLWLTGVLVNERTIASTSALLDARTGDWSRQLVAALGLPPEPFAGTLVEPGTPLGPALAVHTPIGGVPVHTVAGHDTASAFAAAPVANADAAILSSGTWSLLGTEIPAPLLGGDAAAFDLTNERGVDGTIRLLRNVMGLWLVQELRREWDADYDVLTAAAASATDDVAVFDPDDGRFLAPGPMSERITTACAERGQAPPASRGELVRATLQSLACKYRLVLEQLERVTGRCFDAVHVIGGGARNELLCALTADITERPVIAGPVEATALGNVLVQARAAGELGTLADLRAVAAASAEPRRYEPRPGRSAIYDRFLAVTGLVAPAPV